MRLIYENDDFLVVCKPYGQNTHKSDSHPESFVSNGCLEDLEKNRGMSLYTVHRLDQQTSGLLLFAKNKNTAQIFFDLFKNHHVQKTYSFLTVKKNNQKNYSQASWIEKQKDIYISKKSPAPNAQTDFVWLKEWQQWQVWKAHPLSGKPHQIRLHAADLQLPILGDKIYGSMHSSTSCFRLCLHATELKFTFKDQPYHFVDYSCFWLQSSIENIYQAAYYEASTFRKDLLSTNTFRLFHHEFLEFRWDVFGNQSWVYWYEANPPSPDFLTFFSWVQTQLQKNNSTRTESIYIRHMLNRGQNPHLSHLWSLGNPSPIWTAEEHGVFYEMRSDQGLSPGLFLDQRHNRMWVQKNSENKKVLNLFAYTGGFSLNAAIGKAAEVTTVDVSSNFLKWARQNFQKNQLLDSEKYSFFQQDSLIFLQGCIKRLRKFDLIICDPPTLGRKGQHIFSLTKDFENLLVLLSQVLSSEGKILFCTNYEKWSYKDLEKKLRPLPLKILNIMPTDKDFERPSERPLMKSLLLEHR